MFLSGIKRNENLERHCPLVVILAKCTRVTQM